MSEDPEGLAGARTLAFAALAIVILGNTAGNVLLKHGATSAHRYPSLLGLNVVTIAGIACFAFAILAYAWSLKHVELNVAQMVVSVQYICVIGAAALVFGEQISPMQWLGFGLIGLGIFVCSR